MYHFAHMHTCTQACADRDGPSAVGVPAGRCGHSGGVLSCHDLVPSGTLAGRSWVGPSSAVGVWLVMNGPCGLVSMGRVACYQCSGRVAYQCSGRVACQSMQGACGLVSMGRVAWCQWAMWLIFAVGVWLVVNAGGVWLVINAGGVWLVINTCGLLSMIGLARIMIAWDWLGIGLAMIGCGVRLVINDRIGKNHINTVYTRYFRQGNHQIYGHLRFISISSSGQPELLLNQTWRDVCFMQLRRRCFLWHPCQKDSPLV